MVFASDSETRRSLSVSLPAVLSGKQAVAALLRHEDEPHDNHAGLQPRSSCTPELSSPTTCLQVNTYPPVPRKAQFVMYVCNYSPKLSGLPRWQCKDPSIAVDLPEDIARLVCYALLEHLNNYIVYLFSIMLQFRENVGHVFIESLPLFRLPEVNNIIVELPCNPHTPMAVGLVRCPACLNCS